MMRAYTIFPTITGQDRALRCYLKEVQRIPLLSVEEEVQLARRIRRGDEAALERLVRGNLRFVVAVAGQFPPTSLSTADLISEGNLGLVAAARRFDERRGFKFISYAVWWIRKYMMAAISDRGRLVRLPGGQIETLRRLQEDTARLEQQLERLPTAEELAAATGLRETEVALLLAAYPRPLSIDAPLEEGESPTLLDVLSDPAAVPDRRLVQIDSLRVEIDKMLSGLKPREERILRMCFGLNHDVVEDYAERNLEDIGQALGLCAERVRILKNRALQKLRWTAVRPEGAL